MADLEHSPVLWKRQSNILKHSGNFLEEYDKIAPKLQFGELASQRNEKLDQGCKHTLKINLMEPQNSPNHSGFTCTKTLIMSKKGSKESEKVLIFLKQVPSLPCWECAAQNFSSSLIIIVAFSHSCHDALSSSESVSLNADMDALNNAFASVFSELSKSTLAKSIIPTFAPKRERAPMSGIWRLCIVQRLHITLC